MGSAGRLLPSSCCGQVTLSSLGVFFEDKQYLVGLLGLLGNMIYGETLPL